MALDPIHISQSVHDSYLRYLSTTFYLRDPDLFSQFGAQLSQTGKFVKGPLLEATPPFETGASVADLIAEGVLSPEFSRLQTDSLPLARPLYRHQEQAIRRLVSLGRNLVVTTGTGSGKTETFLIPVLNHLLTERRHGSLGPGVRALLLYPMNALANDQIARLRSLLAGFPDITFGRFTGETPNRVKEAVDKYRRTFRTEPTPNELVAREQMRAAPPHILLTNYAMLEYLLLRPDDNVFFDGPFAGAWRFLVVDEAHVYAGAKGIEMAMLLRRLKDRVMEGKEGRLQCIATSATLGKGEESFGEVAHFAQQLFGERFEWNPEDSTQRDVVKATRLALHGTGSADWSAGPSLYLRWRTLVSNRPGVAAADLVRAAADLGVDLDAEPAADGSGVDDVSMFLFHILRRNAHIAHLRAMLEKGPCYLNDVAETLFGSATDATEATVALVDLAAKAKPRRADHALIPARYHLFVRAIEGAYVALSPERRLYLERREQVTLEGQTYAVFELAACRNCGAAYLVGRTEHGGDREYLRHPSNRLSDFDYSLEFYLLLDDAARNAVADEDDWGDAEETSVFCAEDSYRVCSRCGAIGRSNLLLPMCACGSEHYVDVGRVKSKDGKVHGCPACGARNPSGLVWRFLTGNDATASVLATALYQGLPAARPVSPDVAFDQRDEDEWIATPVTSALGTPADETLSGRQLLIFSDSRQAAAFFAPYLDRTYSQILRRRLIVKTLEAHRDSLNANRWRVQDLVGPLQRQAERSGLFAGMSQQERVSEIWKWLLYELLAFDRHNSLESVGCLGFTPVQPEAWSPPRPLLEWGLTAGEVWALYQMLLNSLRNKGALAFPQSVPPQDEFFAPRNRETFVVGRTATGGRASQGSAVIGWEPARSNMTNARLDFVLRLGRRCHGPSFSTAQAREILAKIWANSLRLHDPSRGWHTHFTGRSLPGIGTGYQLRWDVWELQPGSVDPSVSWYICDKCGGLTLHNLRGVCPTYLCDGRLHPCDPAAAFAENHYRRLYTELAPLPLIAKEHTAQLTSEAAAELQTRFIQHEVNVLSCSTTFELGVDVGELESVFMRNVPPSTANYVQRAGRAGRRTDSTALALTFAQRRSHDLTHFNDPRRIVSGEIKAPHFELANEKIVRRHVYAAALAAFWRTQPDAFGNVSDLFFRTGPTGRELLSEFLDRRPEALRQSLLRIVPPALHDTLQVDTWGWTEGLLDGVDGVLARAEQEAVSDVERLTEARVRLIEQGRPSDHILRVINTIQRAPLINYLSSRNALPKYGFPVDVVELQILHQPEAAKGLELARDLRIALSEYAPSSEIVAGGQLWTSRYLKKMPDRAWRTYRYAVCDHCGHYQSELADVDGAMDLCRACGEPLHGRNRGVFIVPEFGFIADTRPPGKPGDAQPERTYATRTYFSGEAKRGETVALPLRRSVVTATPATAGKMAVINHAGYRGFKVCYTCGYTLLNDEPASSPHQTPWGYECRGRLKRVFLGHEFLSDVLQLQFTGFRASDPGFWLSLLYAVLEGASQALDIDRQDIDGCLYPFAGDPSMPALILYDDVPGGAGHVHRLARDGKTLLAVFHAALERLMSCGCGGESGSASCYGCLRNYRNQFCHDQLKRGVVIDFLQDELTRG